MNENGNEVLLTLSSLYEILLQIGKSFDINENARSFLRTLMLQQNLSFAGFFTLSPTFLLRKVETIPKRNVDSIELNASIIDSFKHSELTILQPGEEAYEVLSPLVGGYQKEIAIYSGGEKSILILARRSERLYESELNRYALVFDKFSLFMESLSSHNQINQEI